MTNLKFPLIALVVSLTLSLAAKGEDDETLAGPQNVAPDNGKGEVVAGQHNVTGPGKPYADYLQGQANKSVEGVNEAMRDLDKKIANTDTNLTHDDALAVRKQVLDARWAIQKKVDTVLPELQKSRGEALQYVASHPEDKKAAAAALQLENAYNQVVKMGNENGTKIWRNTNYLSGEGVKDLPAPPNKIEKVVLVPPKAPSNTADNTLTPPKAPPVKPIDPVVQPLKGGKPPGPSDTVSDASKPPPDDGDKPPQHPPPTNDSEANNNTQDNIDYLIKLAQKLKDQSDKKATENPDDPWAAGRSVDAQHAIDELQEWRKRVSNRITEGLVKKYPADHAENNTGGDTGDYPGANPIEEMIGPGGLGGPMASNQGSDGTQEFINNVSGNNGSDGHPSNQTKEVARENAKEIAREATREAANTAREHARPSTDSMRNCPDGH